MIIIAYNKPPGIVCTTEKVDGNIVDAVRHPQSLIPIGRLDKDSEGLILLTDTGSIINKIINPDFGHDKEYEVTVNLPLRNRFLKEMSAGVNIGDAITLPCKAIAVPNTRRSFRIILQQGLNRQIRRMCTKLGYQVIKLQRVRVLNIHLGKLKLGEWRQLTEAEVSELLQLIA